ncbi:MAG: FAD-binding oxidoreductase [Erysipelotrichaceae bacterium]|nr:FAD-binding oxidoreductase [Erysipelotrichaceae bacterium]
MNFKKIDSHDIEFFQKTFGKDNVFTAELINEKYYHDEMTEYGRYVPDAVCLAENAEQISQLMKYCYDNNIAVTPRGAGTGLCGGSVCIHGGVMLSVEKMNRIEEIDADTMTAVVQPGVLLMELAAVAGQNNLLYAPDPGEKSASLGGNVMTNAGGMRAVRYGVTRDYVKGMDVVLPDGRQITLGGKIAKNSSGYSLKDLFIGSEGTLGIVTRLYLKLLAKPQKMISLLIPFNDLKQCLEIVPRILALPNRPTTLEFCEQEVIEDASEYLGSQFPSKDYAAYLIVSYSGANKAEIETMYDDTCKLVLDNGAVDVLISDTDERQESIWNARGAFLEAINNSTTSMDECDVVVPIDRIYEYLQYVRELSDKYQVRIRSFGHAGDGNLHVYVCKDDIADEPWKKLVSEVMEELYSKADELKGLTSGEHGIGHAKKPFLNRSLGPVQIELMRGIKRVFDPKGILNPGKVVDIE